MIVVVQYGPTNRWRVVDTITGIVVAEFATEIEAHNHLVAIVPPPETGKTLAEVFAAEEAQAGSPIGATATLDPPREVVSRAAVRASATAASPRPTHRMAPGKKKK